MHGVTHVTPSHLLNGSLGPNEAKFGELVCIAPISQLVFGRPLRVVDRIALCCLLDGCVEVSHLKEL